MERMDVIMNDDRTMTNDDNKFQSSSRKALLLLGKRRYDDNDDKNPYSSIYQLQFLFCCKNLVMVRVGKKGG